MTRRYSFRDLTTIADFQSVFALERAVWELPNGDDAVPVHLFAASVPHGAILVGAFDDTSRLVGFVYSFPALAGNRLVQWSHMLGVDAGHRGRGLGRQLKLEQRSRALTRGVDLIVWTFDPLQDVNAAFNLNALRAEAREYLEDVYGASDSPLHAGAPTDRLVVEWQLRSAGVEAVVSGGSAPRPLESASARAENVLPVANDGSWIAPGGEPDVTSRAALIGLRVPARFTEMLRERPDLARSWRAVTRRVFSAYFARGYRAVRFEPQQGGGGSYVLARPGT